MAFPYNPENKNILFMPGSFTQCIMMHQVALRLQFNYNCLFISLLPEGVFLEKLDSFGLLNSTSLGSESTHLKNTLKYLKDRKINPVESDVERILTVLGQDIYVPQSVIDSNSSLYIIQEGNIQEQDIRYKIVKLFGLPLYLADTATAGESGLYDLYFVASQGVKQDMVSRGADTEKIIAEGIPNFDNYAELTDQEYPYKDSVFVATSPLRETFAVFFGGKKRAKLLQEAYQRAKELDAPLIIKLHPFENQNRTKKEIKEHAPDAKIVTDSAEYHAVNCRVLFTETSTVTLAGLLDNNKEIHSMLNLDRLRNHFPIQNNGESACIIAKKINKNLEQRL